MYGDLMRESAVIDVHSLDTKYRLVPYVRVWHRISYGSSRISSVFALQNSCRTIQWATFDANRVLSFCDLGASVNVTNLS